MRKSTFGLCAALALALMIGAPRVSQAGGWNGWHGGWHGGGWHGGSRTTFVFGFGAPFFGFGAPFGVPWGFGAPVWAPFPAPVAVGVPVPVVVQSQPQVFVQQQQQADASPSFWYYCQKPQGYFPYVRQCPGGWMQVVPQTTPPS